MSQFTAITPLLRRTPLVGLLLLTGALSAACIGGETTPASAATVVQSDLTRAEASITDAQGASRAVEAFSADLYGILARPENNEGNFVFSPYSAAIALAMTRAGATGETADQMDRVLHAALAGDLHAGLNAIDQALATRPGSYPMGDSEVELELATANQLWAQDGFPFESAFLDQLATKYGAGVRIVDYIAATEAAREAINTWVADQTRDRIPNLIPEGVLNDFTRLVLTNAIYLKAPWQHPFAEGATAPTPFQRVDGTEVSAQIMRTSGGMRYTAGDGYQAVELPYVGGSLGMVAIVPDAGTFESFQSALDAATVGSILDALTSRQVMLGFPRFEFRTQAQLKPALSELGMPIAFTADADFSAMSSQGDDLLIQDVVHEAFISVDEEGTEAAAATAVVVGTTSAPADPVDLTVDRPFIFLIHDAETGAILFLGRVLDPTE